MVLSQNTAVGANALASTVSSLNNTAVGYNALTNNTTQYNTAVGYAALQANVGAQGNTSVGAVSFTASTGGSNTGLGTSSGTAIGTGSGNTLIGNQSGSQLPGASSNNTFVGGEVNASKGLTSASSGNTIIGANYVSPSTSLTNTAILTDGVSSYPRFLSDANAKAGIRNENPTAVLQLAAGTANFGKAPLKFTYYNLTTTAATGTGSTATLTFAAQQSIPFSRGDTIVVAGVTPAGYNGTFKVTGSTTTTVSYLTSTTGAQTVAGTITIGQLTTNPEAGAMEYSPALTSGTTRPYFTGADGVRGVISLTFTGTAAPATTPSAVGDHFVDTTNKKEYVATGTSSSADWTILN